MSVFGGFSCICNFVWFETFCWYFWVLHWGFCIHLLFLFYRTIKDTLSGINNFSKVFLFHCFKIKPQQLRGAQLIKNMSLNYSKILQKPSIVNWNSVWNFEIKNDKSMKPSSILNSNKNILLHFLIYLTSTF